MKTVPKTILSIAGFDPSSGAGLTADLKVFAAHGFFGVACPTALTVQSTVGVRSSTPVPPGYVRDTLTCLAEDIGISGIKIGMLGSATVVKEVVAWLRAFLQEAEVPVVVDPVLRASSGAALLDEEARPFFQEQLLPFATVVTPNLLEAALLSGREEAERGGIPGAARLLQERLRSQDGALRTAIVVTGGHLDREGTPDEYLLLPGASEGSWVRGEWIDTSATHGTGCAFSSALTCELVQGKSLKDAVRSAKRYVEGALRAAYPIGRGRGPMHHLFRQSSS